MMFRPEREIRPWFARLFSTGQGARRSVGLPRWYSLVAVAMVFCTSGSWEGLGEYWQIYGKLPVVDHELNKTWEYQSVGKNMGSCDVS